MGSNEAHGPTEELDLNRRVGVLFDRVERIEKTLETIIENINYNTREFKRSIVEILSTVGGITALLVDKDLITLEKLDTLSARLLSGLDQVMEQKTREIDGIGGNDDGD